MKFFLLKAYFYFLLYSQKKALWSQKLSFWFSLDLHVLGSLENDSAYFWKMSVYVFVKKIYGRWSSRINAHNVMKLYIYLHLEINHAGSILAHNAQQNVLVFHFSRFYTLYLDFCKNKCSASFAWNLTKLYIQDT